MEFDLRAGAGFDVRTRALILPGGKPRDVITSQGGELARQKERLEQALSEGDRRLLKPQPLWDRRCSRVRDAHGNSSPAGRSRRGAQTAAPCGWTGQIPLAKLAFTVILGASTPRVSII